MVFLWSPLLVWFNSALPILSLAGCYLGLVFLNLLQFRHAHRLLYAEDRLDRLKEGLIVLISPADAIHARDKLAHPLLSTFSPLAVARVVTSPASFAEFAGEVSRDLEHPDPAGLSGAGPGGAANRTWFRDCLRQQVAQLLTSAGLDLTQLLRPPPRDEADVCAYCPRCLGQFTQPTGTCVRCGDRPLVAWK